MRKLLIIASAFLLLTGCRKDEDELTSNELTGNWKLFKVAVLDGKTSKELLSEAISCGGEIEFLKKNQVKMTEVDPETCERIDTTTGTYTYTPATKILVFTDENDSEEYLVRKKNTREMELENVEGYDFNSDGTDDKLVVYFKNL